MHRIEPVANVKTSAIAVAYAENCYDGGINASADDVQLSAVGIMGRLNVVYAHGDSDDAWGIDQKIEDSSQVIAFRTKTQEHLQEILYGKSSHTCKYQPAWTLIASVDPLHLQVGDAEDNGIDEHEDEACEL